MSEVLCQWTAHPARRRPHHVALVVAVVAVTCAAVLSAFESAFLALLAAVLLLVSVGPFLLPTRYTLTDEGVESVRAFTRRARRWSELRRLEVGGDVALVSPFARPHPLDRYRGLFLYLDGADRDRVVSMCRQRIAHE